MCTHITQAIHKHVQTKASSAISAMLCIQLHYCSCEDQGARTVCAASVAKYVQCSASSWAHLCDRHVWNQGGCYADHWWYLKPGDCHHEDIVAVAEVLSQFHEDWKHTTCHKLDVMTETLGLMPYLHQ